MCAEFGTLVPAAASFGWRAGDHAGRFTADDVAAKLMSEKGNGDHPSASQLRKCTTTSEIRSHRDVMSASTVPFGKYCLIS